MNATGHLRRALLVRRLAPIAKDTLGRNASGVNGFRRRILDRLMAFSDEAVRDIAPRCASDEDYGRMVALHLLEGGSEGLLVAYSAIGWGRADARAIHKVLEAGSTQPEVRRVLDSLAPGPSPEMEAIDAYVRAIRRILDEFRHDRSRAEGILCWEGLDISTGAPADPELTQIILDRPDDAERIADIVIARQTGRAAEVAALLDGTAAVAVAEGAL